MANKKQLRSVLASMVACAGKLVCDTPEIAAIGQAALEAQRLLDEPEAAGCDTRPDLPQWHVRYSKVPHHEHELTLAVYDAATGKTVCRVVDTEDRGSAERITRLLAAAPVLCDTLGKACDNMRNFGCCIYPACDKCKIGTVLAEVRNGKG